MAISKINWVGVDSSRKPTRFVHIDLQPDIDWTALYSEDTTSNEQNRLLGDKFEKLVTSYLNQIDKTTGKPTQKMFINPKTNIMRHAVSCGNSILEKFGMIDFAKHVGRSSNTESGDIHITKGGSTLILEMKYIGHSASGSWNNAGANFLACVDSAGECNFMTVVEAFDKKINETYSLKTYVDNIADVKLLHDIPGVKFSTGRLSFFDSLTVIVEPLYKMGVVKSQPKKQLTPFKIGRTTIVDSRQRLVLYKNGGKVFVKHEGKEDGVELKFSNNWIFDNGVDELQIAPSSIYTLMMQLGLDFCKTLKDDHFKKLKNNKKFLPRLYEAVYGKLMTSGQRTGHKKETPNYVVKFIRRGASGNTIIQSTKDYMGRENKEPYVENAINGKARFYLCKGNIKFPIQYRWKGGAMMDNLSFHVEMPLDIDQKDTRGENGKSSEDET